VAARSHHAPRSVSLARWRWSGARPSDAPCGSRAPDRPQGQTPLAVAGSLPQATRRRARPASRPVGAGSTPRPGWGGGRGPGRCPVFPHGRGAGHGVGGRGRAGFARHREGLGSACAVEASTAGSGRRSEPHTPCQAGRAGAGARQSQSRGAVPPRPLTTACSRRLPASARASLRLPSAAEAQR
jgi:hypothetical protein